MKIICLFNVLVVKPKLPQIVFLYRKDFEINQLNCRIEDELALAVQLQKKLKELQVNYLREYLLLRYFPDFIKNPKCLLELGSH